MSLPNREAILKANAQALALAGLSPTSSGSHLERVKRSADPKVAAAAKRLIEAQAKELGDYGEPDETPPLDQQDAESRRQKAVHLDDGGKCAYEE